MSQERRDSDSLGAADRPRPVSGGRGPGGAAARGGWGVNRPAAGHGPTRRATVPAAGPLPRLARRPADLLPGVSRPGSLAAPHDPRKPPARPGREDQGPTLTQSGAPRGGIA